MRTEFLQKSVSASLASISGAEFGFGTTAPALANPKGRNARNTGLANRIGHAKSGDLRWCDIASSSFTKPSAASDKSNLSIGVIDRIFAKTRGGDAFRKAPASARCTSKRIQAKHITKATTSEMTASKRSAPLPTAPRTKRQMLVNSLGGHPSHMRALRAVMDREEIS